MKWKRKTKLMMACRFLAAPGCNCLRSVRLPPSLCRSALRPPAWKHVGLCSQFHTSPARRVWFMAPIARIGAALAGRLTRSWWARLPQDRRNAIKAAIGRRKRYIYGVFGVLSAGGVVYYCSHLEHTPITGRRRFMMFSREDVLKLIEGEKTWILETVSDGKEPLPTSHPIYQSTLSIATAILSKNWSPEFEGLNWTLFLIDNPNIINAICLPSGEIFVFTGLVNACHNNDELAFILSHEVSHAILGHGAEGLSHKGIINFFGLVFIGIIWAIIPNDLISYFLHRFSHSTAEVLFDYPYSRELEQEADRVGLMFAAKACFEPEKAVKIWTHLKTGDKAVEFLSTHPSNERRYDDLSELLPMACRYDDLSELLPMANTVWQENRCDEEMKEEVDNFQKTVRNVLKRMAKWW